MKNLINLPTWFSVYPNTLVITSNTRTTLTRNMIFIWMNWTLKTLLSGILSKLKRNFSIKTNNYSDRKWRTSKSKKETTCITMKRWKITNQPSWMNIWSGSFKAVKHVKIIIWFLNSKRRKIGKIWKSSRPRWIWRSRPKWRRLVRKVTRSKIYMQIIQRIVV